MSDENRNTIKVPTHITFGMAMQILGINEGELANRIQSKRLKMQHWWGANLIPMESVMAQPEMQQGEREAPLV